MTRKEILAENKQRLDRMFSDCDQYTGRGFEGHTELVVIPDLPGLERQWVTPQVANNPLYKAVTEAGSIAQYVDTFNTYYANDPDITTLTSEELIGALFKVRVERDPAFAFYTVFTIKYKKGGEGPFKLNYAQRVTLSLLESMRMAGIPIRVVLLKARQWGGSTLVQLYCAWLQLFVIDHWYSVVIAQTKDTARRIKAMYRKTLERIPSFLFDADKVCFTPYEGSSNDSIVTNGSGRTLRDAVITTASYENFDSTRGQDYALAHFSEVAYWRPTKTKTADEVIRAIEGNILEDPGTLEVAESTARGMSGWFYDEYQLAKRGKSARRALFIPFFYLENDMIRFKTPFERAKFADWLYNNRHETVAPDVTAEPGEYLWGLWLKGATLEHINWYIQKRATFHDHAQMASEAPSDDIECFKFSGGLVFSISYIDEAKDRHQREPIFRGEIFQGGKDSTIPLLKEGAGQTQFQIWAKPAKGNFLNRYLVVVDVGGRSQGADYSVITVIDRWPLKLGGAPKVVARWRGHLRYDLMAWKAVYIARHYGNCMIVFESNTFDKKKAEATEFVEQGDHILGILHKIGQVYKNLYMRPATSEEDIKRGVYTKIGFQTNAHTKQEMVDLFIADFEDGKFIDPDSRFYEEAAIYEQRPDGSYGNIPGALNHDDILMTDMIGNLVSSKMPLPTIVRTPEPEEEDLAPATINESSF